MKTLSIFLIAVGSLLSGCMAHDRPNRATGVYGGDSDRVTHRMDRNRSGSGSGVPMSEGLNPKDPTR